MPALLWSHAKRTIGRPASSSSSVGAPPSRATAGGNSCAVKLCPGRSDPKRPKSFASTMLIQL